MEPVTENDNVEPEILGNAGLKLLPPQDPQQSKTGNRETYTSVNHGVSKPIPRVKCRA